MKKIKLLLKILIIIFSCLIFFPVLIFLKSYLYRDTGYKKVEAYRHLFGLSLANSTASVNMKLIEDIDNEKYNKDINFIVKEAGNDAKHQCEDIDELEKYGVDILIISPIDDELVRDKIKSVNKNIPVIILDDRSFFDYGTAFIEYNNYEAGRLLAERLKNESATENGIVLISGMKDEYVNKERERGFLDNLDKAHKEGLTVLEGNKNRDDAENIMKYYLVSGRKAGCVVALDDEMAYGAYLGARKLREFEIKFYGINGFEGETKGRELENKGILEKTVGFENMYETVTDTALKIVENEDFKKYYVLDIKE